MTDLIDSLARTVRHYRVLAVLNYVATSCLFLIAVLSSGIATLLAATKTEAATLVATLAGMPAIVILVNNTFRFEPKSLWHFQKRRRLEALLRTLKVGTCPPQEAVATWNLIDDDMDKQWPGFGQIPAKPQSPSTRG
jgi:hypothetical protein